MPYAIKKLANGKFQVKNIITGEIHAKGTTKTKAEKQVRLMEWMDSRKKK
jgi:hypothetical protein